MQSTTQDHGTSRRRLRLLMGTAVLALALTLGASTWQNSIGTTAAAWQAQSSATGTLTAGTVPAPTLTQACQFRPGLLGLGARVLIFWSIPEGYTLDDIEVQASTSGLGSVLAPLTGFSLSANSQETADGYQTEVPANLLGGLLGLGSELEIAIRVSDPNSDWTSESVSVASNAGLLAGLGGNCRNLS